jgi:hypothetical protein
MLLRQEGEGEERSGRRRRRMSVFLSLYLFLPFFGGKSEKQMDAGDKLVIEGARGEEGSRIRRGKRRGMREKGRMEVCCSFDLSVT